MERFIKENKFYLIFCLGVLFAGLLYNIFGHSIIKIVYGPAGYSDASLEYDLALADKIAFLILAGLSVCFLLYMLVFSQRKTALLWPILIFTCILVLIYKFNPNNRVYSAHGFMHAGIVYQILNGGIPPTNPLLAGETLFYPWGFEFIAAVITNIFNITPFISFSILNIASLVIAIFLIYKISCILIKDKNANILSAIISIFGITILNKHLLALMGKIGIFVEQRGIPVFNKFSNINGAPLGLVFFLLYLYSAINVFVGEKSKFNAILFFLSILGGGFVYPQFLPSIIASTICLCLVNVVSSRKEDMAFYLRKSILIIMLLVVGTLIIVPYISCISSGVGRKAELFNLKSSLVNTISYFTVCFPILLVIFINRRFLWKYLDRRVLIIIITTIAVTFSYYIFIHMPLHNEYKALILSTVTLGILGGISLSAMRQWCNRSVVFIILLILIFPSFENIYSKIRYLDDLPVTYIEKGKYIYSKNAEENELYEWIRGKTAKDDTFIDHIAIIPIFAQRQLFIAKDVLLTVNKGTESIVMRMRYPGYYFQIGMLLQVVFGYDPDLLESRENIVRSIYNLNQDLTSEQINELLASNLNDIYVIVRRTTFQGTFSRRGFEEIFRSSRGNYLAYRYIKSVSH